MPNLNETLKVVAFEDGSSAVVKIDPANPRLLEVVATFFETARAQLYVKLAEGRNHEPAVTKELDLLQMRGSKPVASKKKAAAANGKAATLNGAKPELSDRQSAVLTALRAKMDESRKVEAKAADLAQAAQIPLGSLHSVLGSLEKKQLIVNTRPGSPRSPAVYQVL